jgi:hypothetical protein
VRHEFPPNGASITSNHEPGEGIGSRFALRTFAAKAAMRVHDSCEFPPKKDCRAGLQLHRDRGYLIKGVLTDTHHEEDDMNTLLLSTLLFHSLGTIAMLVGMALAACLPERRPARRDMALW